MNAVIAGHAGTPQLKQFHMVNIKMFRHPKYYKELRKRNTEAVAKSGKSHASLKSDQVISGKNSTECKTRASWSGPKASSFKQQATKPQASSDKLKEIQASSGKHQAPSSKHQATSRKQQAPGSGTLQKVSSTFDQGTLPR
tara:strand:+ start:167 stop:589 length:423 start_codon:yes stop_codon:yes gene_type:complete